MKKRVGTTLFTLLGIVYVIINVILFILIDKHLEEQLSNGVFWFVWAMTFVFTAGVTCFIYFTYKTSKQYDDITVPALIYVMGIFNVIYIVLGLILMFIPSVKFTLALVLELILTGGLIGFLVMFKNVTGYMKDNNAAEKVKAVRMLKLEVDQAVGYVDNPEIIKALNELSEEIRFSDPMSSLQLRAIEEQIELIVGEILVAAMEKDYESLPTLIDKARKQLKVRNAKCAILK